MIEDFIFWLKGIEEDTPLPHEIQHLYFCLHTSNNYLYISFGGNQFEEKIVFNFEYYPLEAQFFNIYSYDKKFNLKKLRILIEKIIELPYFQTLYKNCYIYISYFGEKYNFIIDKS